MEKDMVTTFTRGIALALLLGAAQGISPGTLVRVSVPWDKAAATRR